MNAYKYVKGAVGRRKKWIDTNFKIGKPCSDCGVCYPPYVMDFDHLPGTNKQFGIGSGVLRNGKKKLALEISKCELVCANCHRERSHRRQ